MYIKRKEKKRRKREKEKEKKREVENKVKIHKESPHKRTESPWISSKPALFSVLY